MALFRQNVEVSMLYSASYIPMSTPDSDLSSDGNLNLNTCLNVDNDLLDDLSGGVQTAHN